MRLAAWLLAAVALALATASPAAAWTRQRVANSDYDYGGAVLAGNERGNAALVFDGTAGLYVAVAEPGRDFGRPRLVPRSRDGGFERIAVDERGDVLVGWTYNDGSKAPRPNQRDEGCCRRIRLALLRHGSSRFVVSSTMGRPGFDSQLRSIAIVNGRVGVAWDDFGFVSARFSRRGLALGSPVRVAGASGVAAMPLRTGPVLTLQRAEYAPGTTDFSVDWSIGELRVGRSAIRTLYSRRGGYPGLALAANAHGEQAIAWTESVGTSEYDVYAAFRKPGEVFHPRRLSQRGSFESPHVALASTGAALIAWDRVGKRVLVAARRPGGGFGDARGFSALNESFVYSLQVGVAPSGRALVTWLTHTGQAQAAFRDLDGRRIGLHQFGQGLGPGALLDTHGIARLALRRPGGVYAFRGSFPR